MGDAEIWFSKLGKVDENGEEPKPLEVRAASILKAWWFQTLLAISFIWAKRQVMDYINGGADEDEDEDEDEDQD